MGNETFEFSYGTATTAAKMVIMTMETIASSFDFPINGFNSFAKMIYYG
jgi:hypothetical protein